jgi:hypothetical protein
VPLPALLSAGLAIMAGNYAGMGAAGGVAVAVAFSLAGGVGNALEPHVFLTALQERTPDALQTDVNALIEALRTAAPGLGFVLGGAAAWAVSPRTTYWAAALAVVALLIVVGRGLLRPPSAAGAVAARA